MASSQKGLNMIGLCDIHVHAIPSVDDGPGSLEIAIGILRDSYQGGVRHMILTPHFRLGMFETSDGKIKENYEALKKEATSLFPDLELRLGCEFHANMEMAELLTEHPRFFLAGSNYLLLEFSGQDNESYIRSRVQEAQSVGARVIIAHPERYLAFRKRPDFADEIRRMGALLQVNADAVLGKDGFGIKRFTTNLMKKGLVDFIASDAHDLKTRSTHLPECADAVANKYGADIAEKIFIRNPEEILKDH